MKKTLALALALMLALSSAAFAATLSPLGEYPLVVGQPEKLTILMEGNNNITDYDDNAFTKFIEESLNVDIEFTLLPAADSASKLQIMVVSGEALPDVINYSDYGTSTYSYAQAGAIIALDELYEQYSVKLKAVVREHPEFYILEAITAPDGKFYSIPEYRSELNNHCPFRMYINTTWLEALNLKKPETTDEFYEVLKAFKEQDPNGNGIADEIPMTAAMTAHNASTNPITYLMNSFTYATPGNYFQVNDGKLGVCYTTDGWKEGLKYIRKLYSEGLIDSQAFTQTSSQMSATRDNEDICIVGAYASQGMSTKLYIKDFECMFPLEGPKGVQYAHYAKTVAHNQWMITSDCQNPELAFRAGDFMFDEEVTFKARLGVEGLTWRKPLEGEVSLYGEGYDPYFLTIESIWSKPENYTWKQVGPFYTTHFTTGKVLNPDDIGSIKNAPYVIGYPNYGPEPGTYVPFLNYTEDENFAISDISASLLTYMIESSVLFIVGDSDIDGDWDAYLAELENIGLQQYLDVSQQAYDRIDFEL